MDKVIRNGKVAVLVSPGFGAGWYSWNKDFPQILFHPKLVEIVENGKMDEIDNDWVQENIGIDIYCGGAEDLSIHWLPVGTRFIIEEYDGSESLQVLDDINFLTA